MNARTLMRAVGLVLALAGCGGGDSESPVQYDGDTLVVRGVRYERAAPGGDRVCSSYAPGRLIVSFPAGGQDAAISLLASFGLSVEQSFQSIPALIVNVPVLFEVQWAEALRKESAVSGASLDCIAGPAAAQ